MSTKVMRVPLDFDWPLGEVWEGYLSPDRFQEVNCEVCTHDAPPTIMDRLFPHPRSGTGSTAAREWIGDFAHMILMLADEVPEFKNPNADSARTGSLHPWLASMEHRPHVPPSAEIRELTGGLAGRPPRNWGHDAIDRWHATDAIIKAAGLDPKTWGICPACNGRGSTEGYEGQRAEAEAWEPSEPPMGEGWQLWSTITEGHPVSPVFASSEGLAGWMSDPERGEDWVPPDVAARYISHGSAPTGIVIDGVAMSGVEAMGTLAEDGPLGGGCA